MVKFFSGLFSELLYSHTRRDDNRVAHGLGLAKFAMNLSECNVWMEDVPSHIQPFVQADKATFS